MDRGHWELLWRNLEQEEMPIETQRNGAQTIQITYKLRTKDLILRSNHFTIYLGICRKETKLNGKRQSLLFSEVSIKKYEKSSRAAISEEEMWREYQLVKSNESNKSLLLAYQDAKCVSPVVVRAVKFREQRYLVLPSMGYVLYDKIKSGVRELKDNKEFHNANIKMKFYQEFKDQLISLLKRNWQASPPLFLGALSPLTIAVTSRDDTEVKKSYTYRLIDLSLANVAKPLPHLTLYDLSYLAPEYKQLKQGEQGPLSWQSDIWSLGCILYQLMSNGEKLITNPYFHDLSGYEQEKFVTERLNELSCKVKMSRVKESFQNKMDFEIVAFLRSCLQVEVGKRWAGEEPVGWRELAREEYGFYENKFVYDISLEIFLLNILQDSLFSIFEEFYFNSRKLIEKYQVYPLLRFGSCYYLELYNRLKDKSKSYAKNQKWDKHTQVKRIQEEKKLIDIREKAGAKMLQELDQRKLAPVKARILSDFPQAIESKVFHPRLLFRQYWLYIKEDLCREENKNFYKFLYLIHFCMKSVYEIEVWLNQQQLTKTNLSLNPDKLEKQKDPEIAFFTIGIAINDAVEKKLGEILSGDKVSVEHKMAQSLEKALAL